ncbi:protein of unknown function [Nitrospira japonica]|uniref:Uncharacterized protein n=1 Tax=Nitrospira japonica TaxID=1325564 RepID=A0A1W1I1H9_9BACT|nr:protein of unknown function [Nitrospira japonica]
MAGACAVQSLLTNNQIFRSFALIAIL